MLRKVLILAFKMHQEKQYSNNRAQKTVNFIIAKYIIFYKNSLKNTEREKKAFQCRIAGFM